MLYGSKNLDNVCPDWKEQIKNILVDLYNSGTYKLTMYPHCHFIDKEGVMKSIDWYGCIPVSDHWVDAQWMDSIIHHTAKFRLEETGDIVNGKYNLERMFKGSMGKHVHWGDTDMKYIYKEIFGKEPE
jgi:hemerythrin